MDETVEKQEELINVSDSVSQDTSQEQKEAVKEKSEVVSLEVEENKKEETIDILMESQMGNMVPQFLAILDQKMGLEDYDVSGYNLLHNSVAFNKFSSVVPLIEEFKMPVDSLSRHQQTSLMIACNYGFLRMVKYLVEKGANVNLIDSSGFSALLFAVKSNHVQIVIYLLSQRADLNVRDINGCGVVHWAAHSNSTFLLKLFERIGHPMNELDRIGLTPLVRSLYNNSYNSFKYLIKLASKNPKIADPLPEFANIKKITSKSNKLILKKYFYDKRRQERSFFWKFYNENISGLSQLFLVLCSVLVYYSFICGCIYRIPQKSSFVTLLIWLLHLAAFAYIPVLFRFMKQGNQLMQSRFSRQNSPRSNFFFTNTEEFNNINQLFKQAYARDNLRAEDNCLHQIIRMIKDDKIDQVKMIPLSKIDLNTLTFLNNRAFYCPEVGQVVENFGHYSKFFQKVIHKGNHKSYFFLLSMQQASLTLFLFLYLIGYWRNLRSSKFLFWAEIPYILYTQQGGFETYSNFFKIAGFVLSLVMLFQNSLDFFIEVYGILNNLTRYEIRHRFKCHYFFTSMKADQNGQYWKYYRNIYDRGIATNIKLYLEGDVSDSTRQHQMDDL